MLSQYGHHGMVWYGGMRCKASVLTFTFLVVFQEIKGGRKVVATELVELALLSKHHASPPILARRTRKQLVSRVPSPPASSCLRHSLRPCSVAGALSWPVWYKKLTCGQKFGSLSITNAIFCHVQTKPRKL